MKYSKQFFGLLFLIAIMILSCNEKTASAAKKSNIKIKSAFTQKEIPGQQDGIIKTYLNLLVEFTGQEEIIVDSIYFNGKVYTIGAAIHKMKIDLAQGVVSKEQIKLKRHQAILFHSFGNKSSRMIINNIETKEPIYLP